MKLLHIQTLDSADAATIDSATPPATSSAEIIHRIRTQDAPYATTWIDNLGRSGWSASLVALNSAALLAAQSSELGIPTTSQRHESAHRIISALEPDVIILDTASMCAPGFLAALSYRPHLTVGWMPEPLPQPSSLSNIDLILSPQEALRAEARKLGARDAVDFYVGTSLHQIEAHGRPSARTDVAFCGTYDAAHRVRNQLLLELSKGALGWHGGYSTTFVVTRPCDIESMPIGVAMHIMQGDTGTRARLNTLLGAKIAIHAFSDSAGSDEFDPCIFEATAAGAVLLAANKPGLERFFQPGTEAEIFNSSEEMIQKVRKLLDDDGYRSSIAAAGQRRSLTEHSVEARMPALSDILRSRLA